MSLIFLMFIIYQCYFIRELDELEREDFARLKKVQGKKADRQKAEEKEKEREDAGRGKAAASSTNVLSGYDAADDEDVVFK